MGNEKDAFTTVQATESSPPRSIAPRPPYRQERPTWLKTVLLTIDVGLALSPLLFLGIAFAAIAYNHKRVSDDPVLRKNVTIPVKELSYQFYYTAGGQAVIDVAQIAVSIFPILFAAVVGRFMKSYALHRAEHGSTMGVLEQLYGSQNLSNSVQLLFALRGPGFLGIAVVVIWLLSPIGGQGVKRVLGTTDTDVNSTTTIYYCNASSAQSRFSFEQAYGVAHLPMNDALASLFFTDSVSGASDVWGNVKVPYLTSTQATASDWRNVGTDVTYSAMTGLLINNLPNDTVTSFDITTSYVDMTCKDPLTFEYLPPGSDDTIPANMTGYQEFLDWAGPLLYYSNMTNTTVPTTYDSSALAYGDWQYLIDIKIQENTSVWASPPVFVFATQEIEANSTIYAYECASSIQYLEASLTCYPDSSSPCYVSQTRATKQPASLYEHPILAQSAEAGSLPVQSLLLDFINSFDSAKKSHLANYAPQTVMKKYLSGAGTYATSTASTSDWSNITASDLSPRLGSIINTAWLIGVQDVSLAQQKLTNTTRLQISDPTSPHYFYGPEYTSGIIDFDDYIGYDITSAPATKTTTYEIYQVNWPWVIIAIVISLLLLSLGLVGLYFRHTNSHPDVLGFVSTLTRDNPHFEPPAYAERLDGMEMASYYKYTRVQLVNTAASDELGRITLRPVQRD